VTRAPGLLVLGIVLCLLALGFGAPALLVPGLALSLLSSVALGWVSATARRCTVQRSLTNTTVQEDEPLTITVALRRGRLRPPGGALLPWPDVPPLRLGPEQSEATSLRVSFPRRGRHLVAPARALIVDPLGLWTRDRCSPADEVLVLPRVGPVSAARGDGIGAAGRAASGVPQATALEVDTLRPHRPGTPASRIHWPTVARTGTLMEHRLVGESERRPLIVLDTREPADEEALDQAVRAVASLAHHLAQRGGCGVLLPGERRPTALDGDLRAWPALHARLALVASGGAVPSPPRLARAGTLVWVLARSLGSRSARARLGLDRGYVVSPFPIPGRTVMFTAGGCAGQAFGVGAREQVA
jgi:uncharacterized protein (DUF58 family)